MLAQILIFTYFTLFPFGQLLRLTIEIPTLQKSFPIHPIEAVGLISFFTFVGVKNFKNLPNFLKSFLAVGILSFLFSFTIFEPREIVVGILYNLRIISFIGVYLLFKKYASQKGKRESLVDVFLLVFMFVGLFGFIQYFFYPDLRPIQEFGWDNHLYRLTGTLLDPAFTGVILAFGVLTSLLLWYRKKKRKYLFLIVFFLISLLLTYSRASFVALIAGLGFYFIKAKKVKKLFLAIFAFLSLLLLLPRPAGEGVRLERTASITARLNNYKETVKVIQKSPVFGVGYNNYCLARSKFLGDINQASHSCGGSDSSILLLIATVGVVGFLILLGAAVQDLTLLKKGFYKDLFLINAVALITHSLFSNSLFYPFTFPFLLGLFVVARKSK